MNRRRRGLFPATVLANQILCREHYLLRLAVQGLPASQPGQFVQLQCRSPRPSAPGREVPWPADRPPRLSQPELAGKEPLLRRPLSLAGRRSGPEGEQIDLIYRTIGIGTRWLAGVRAGAALSVLGPLGNAFPISPGKGQAALVGGGVGIPPMLYLAAALAEAGKQAVAFCGARSADLLPVTVDRTCRPAGEPWPLPCVEEFAAAGCPSVVASDDGSLGVRGPVSEAFAGWLDRRGPAASDLVVYSCGPEPMMRTVAGACAGRGVECYLAMERHMACGVGTCQSCVCKVRAANDRGWEFKLCCADGPVFDAKDIVW